MYGGPQERLPLSSVCGTTQKKVTCLTGHNLRLQSKGSQKTAQARVGSCLLSIPDMCLSACGLYLVNNTRSNQQDPGLSVSGSNSSNSREMWQTETRGQAKETEETHSLGKRKWSKELSEIPLTLTCLVQQKPGKKPSLKTNRSARIRRSKMKIFLHARKKRCIATGSVTPLTPHRSWIKPDHPVLSNSCCG